MTRPSTSSSSLRLGARIIAVGAVCAVLAYGCTYLLRSRYEASESITFPTGGPTGGSLSQLLTGKAPATADGSVGLLDNAVSSPVVGSNSDAALGITKSQGCLRYVIERNNLMDVYGEHKLSKTIRKLNDRLSTSVDKQGFLNITADDESPDRAVAIVKSVEAYLKLTTERLSDEASRPNTALVREKLEEARRSVHRVEARLIARLAKNPLSQDVAERSKAIWAIRQAAEEAKVKADGAEVQVTAATAKLEKVMHQSTSFSGKQIALASINKSLETLTSDLAHSRTVLEQTRARYQSNSAETRLAQADFDAADKVAGDILNRYSYDLAHDADPSLVQSKATYESLAAQANAYGKTVDRLMGDLARDASAYVLNELQKAELTAAEARMNKRQEDLDSALIAEERNKIRYSIVDDPVAGDEPVYPKRALTVGVVFALVVLLQLAPLLFGASKATEGAV